MEPAVTVEHNGEFWDVRQPRKRWAGVLRVDGEGGAELVLHDKPKTFSDSRHREYDVINGNTIDGKKLALLRCFDTFTRMTSHRLSKRKVYAGVVLEGVHVKSPDPSVYWVEATMRNMNAWWGHSGVRARITKWPKASVRFSPRRPITLSDTAEAKLVAQPTLESFSSGANENGEYRLKEEVRFVLSLKRPRPMSKALSIMTAARDLVSIGCQDYCDFLRLNVSTDKKGHQTAVYHGEPIFKGQGNAKRHKLLFGFDDIARAPRRVFRGWLAEADRTAAMRSLYFLATYGDHFVEGKFLAFCQAIEGFHSRYRPGHYMDKDEFNRTVLEPMMAALPADLDEGLRNSIIGRVRFAYSYSLPMRLRQLFKEHREALEAVVPGADKYIREIVGQRNLLTHDLLAGDAEGRIDGEAFLKFNFLLKTLVELCFLTIMRIPEEQIADLFQRSNRYRGYARRFFGGAA